MKKTTTLLVLMLLICSSIQAQVSLPDLSGKSISGLNFSGKVATAEDSQLPIKGISPKTAFLLLDMKAMEKNPAAITDGYLVGKYHLIRKGNRFYANSFIMGTKDFSISAMDQYGVIPGSNAGNIYTGLIPIDQLANVASAPTVTYVQIGEEVHLRMDSARKATHVKEVHQGLAPLTMPYTGKGVVVGVIDIGFDFTHPNFYDSTGTNNYRIKRVWNQKNNTGTPPSGYAYGSELTTQAAMLNAQTDQTMVDHGSHTTGTAAGAGGYPGSPYRGVAYQSDIVMVAPNPAGSNTNLIDAIQYIQDYAASVNKPCVINMSIGTHMGPHDGKSIFDQFCDYTTGPGKLLVGSAGNEGMDRLHIGRNFSLTDTTLGTFMVFQSSYGNNGDGFADIWGNQNENFLVRISLINANTLTVEDVTSFVPANTSSVMLDTLVGTNSIKVPVSIATGIEPFNNKPHVLVEAYNSAQTNGYRFIMITVIGQNTAINMWTEGATFHNLGLGAPFLMGNSTHTVGEIGGTGNSIITVGAYTSTNTWTALNNNVKNAPAFAAIGAIAPFSSFGPTADGRTKPDITAPGNILASSVNSFSPAYDSAADRTVKSVVIGGKTWYFGMMEGTSMSSPTVAGIMALWLEKYPELTPKQALALMKNTAITDAFTGTVPNLTWGWGKINAYDGLLDLITNIPPKPAQLNPLKYCEGQNNVLTAPTGFGTYQWTNKDTARIITATLAGDYAFRGTNTLGYYSPWSDTAVVHALTPVSIASIWGNTLTSTPAATYQWYVDNTIIPGATQQSHTATKTGSYKVSITDANGCTNMSAATNFVPSGIGNINTNSSISVYPNPATKLVNISFSEDAGATDVALYDITGKKVYGQSITGIDNGHTETVNINMLSPGIYTLKISNSKAITNYKIIKE